MTSSERVAAAVARLKTIIGQETFGLRGFPGERFRLGHEMSHFESEGEIQVVVQRDCGDKGWLDFGRNTPEHIVRNLLP